MAVWLGITWRISVSWMITRQQKAFCILSSDCDIRNTGICWDWKLRDYGYLYGWRMYMYQPNCIFMWLKRASSWTFTFLIMNDGSFTQLNYSRHRMHDFTQKPNSNINFLFHWQWDSPVDIFLFICLMIVDIEVFR